MNSGSKRFLGFVAVVLVIPASFGMAASKDADRQTAQAKLLEHGEYPCNNCFFGTSDNYFCFRAGDKILIGHEKIPTINWRDTDKNYLTRVHKSWQPWKSEGDTVNLKYDDKYIWLPPAAGKKDVRLTQDYATDIFIDSKECRAAVRKPVGN